MAEFTLENFKTRRGISTFMRDQMTLVEPEFEEAYYIALQVVKNCFPEDEHLRKPVLLVLKNNQLRRTLGFCGDVSDYGCRIVLSNELLKINDDRLLLSAIIHELLQTYCDSNGHDRKWCERAIAVNIYAGILITPKTRLTDIVSKDKIRYVKCSNCGAIIEAVAGSRYYEKCHLYTHRDCGGRLMKYNGF